MIVRNKALFFQFLPSRLLSIQDYGIAGAVNVFSAIESAALLYMIYSRPADYTKFIISALLAGGTSAWLVCDGINLSLYSASLPEDGNHRASLGR